MRISDLFHRIDAMAPLRLAAAWDNSGVQVAGEDKDVRRLAVCLDPTPAMVKAGLDWGAQCLLSHHPLYLKPQAPNRESIFLDVMRLALPAGLWLYAAHTSLDQAPGGPAFWLGRELGLEHAVPLEPAGDPELAAMGAGFGQAGDLPSALAWDDFLGLLGGLLDRQVWSVSGRPPARVRRVAYCPGSGGSLMDVAAASGADVYITGDIKYHQAMETSVAVVDVGHFCLEEEMMRRFAGLLRDDLAEHGVDVRFFEGSDPFRFRIPCA